MEQKSAKDLVAEASKHIETLAADDAVNLASDPNVVFVDVREGEELEKTGTLKGAVHVPRGFLEFQPIREAPHTSRSWGAADGSFSIAGPATVRPSPRRR